MCRLWQVPTNFNCSVPRSVGLTGIFTVKVPNIASIKGTKVFAFCLLRLLTFCRKILHNIHFRKQIKFYIFSFWKRKAASRVKQWLLFSPAATSHPTNWSIFCKKKIIKKYNIIFVKWYDTFEVQSNTEAMKFIDHLLVFILIRLLQLLN